MKKLLIALSFLISMAVSSYCACWNLVWHDEFDGPNINTAYWNFETGCGGWGNNELENYLNNDASTAYIENGALVIQANNLNNGGGACGYTSARMTTQDKVHFTYGRIEARIKTVYGKGMWPAFWMLGQNIGSAGWPACGEIDIMEMVGGGSGFDNVQNGTAHWDNNGHASYGLTTSVAWPAKLSDDYHIYAVEWDANQIRWYFDSVNYCTLNTNGASMEEFTGRDFFILLNVAVGGQWPGSPDSSTVFPQKMYVDYVRWYQDGACGPTNTPTPTPTLVTTNIPGNVQFEDYMNGGEGVAYHDTTAGNTPGQYRNDDVDIEACSEAGGGYDLAYTAAGEWLNYSVNVLQAGTYSIGVHAASLGAGGTFHLELDGVNISGAMTVPDTGGWQTWQTLNVNNINIGSTGIKTLKLVMDANGSTGSIGNFNYVSFTVSGYTPTPTMTYTVTQTFSPTFTVTAVAPACSSWVVNGSAFASGSGVTLTTAVNSKAGSAWNSSCINLNNDFNRTFKVYFGTVGGADGIDFVLQQDPRTTAALGLPGGAKGYGLPGNNGITPSVAFDLETYGGNGTLQVLENGDPANTCANAGSTCPYVFPSNVSNGLEHTYQVVWNASQKKLTLIFDGTVVMVYNRDLVASVFGGNSCAYYGFTAATGGSNNIQYIYEIGCSGAPAATATFTPIASNTPVSGGDVLIPLTGGKTMTCQFINNTGNYSDSQIYVIAIGLNAAMKYCHLDAAGNMVPCVSGDNAAPYFIPLSSINGLQFPDTMISVRLYVSLGAPLNIPFNTDGGGNVGIAYPNIDNPADPSYNSVFDWEEFNLQNNTIFLNSSQVDMFGVPTQLRLYDNGTPTYTLNGQMGVPYSLAQIASDWAAQVPAEFQHLYANGRIVAPIHGLFAAGRTYANYFDAYINSIWAQYTTGNLVLTIGSSVYTGRVGGDTRFAFTTPGDPVTYYVSKPTTQDVFMGAGALATGNGTEKQLQAQICAAFNRHVLQNISMANTASAFYQAPPANYYAQFWHKHSLNSLAYGFCYDDVSNQSTTLVSTNPRGMVVVIGANNQGVSPTSTPSKILTPVNTATWTYTATFTATVTNTSTCTATQTISGTATCTATQTSSGTATCTATQTVSGTATCTATQTSSGTATCTATQTVSGTATCTATVPVVIATATNTTTSTAIFTATRIATVPVATSSATATITSTATAVNTWTQTPVDTSTHTSTATNTVQNTATHTSTNTAVNTFTYTATYSNTVGLTPTWTFTPTATGTFIATSTATINPVNTLYPTATITVNKKPEILETLAYPNPDYNIDNTGINISFKLTGTAESVEFRLFTVSYRLIRDVSFAPGQVKGNLKAGINVITIPPAYFKGLAAGSYYYVLRGNKIFSKIKTIIIIR